MIHACPHVNFSESFPRSSTHYSFKVLVRFGIFTFSFGLNAKTEHVQQPAG